MRIIWLACLLLTTATRADWNVRTASQEEASPRYTVLQEGGQQVVKGLCIDILRAIERTDPQIHFTGSQPLPLPRLLKLLEVGQLDAFACLTRNTERDALFQYVDIALFEVSYRMAVRKNDPVLVGSFDDIRRLGKEGLILANRGTGTVNILEAQGGLQIDATGIDQHENLRKLIAGIGRFYYRHDLGLEAEIAESGFGDSVQLLPATFDRQKQFLVLSRQVPLELVNRLRTALSRLRDSGELAKLRSRY
ncbi:substrate-binding periplasmic protein [Chitinimonas sp.]|uniref:substrate-binding periplasmic protein n=1 Tax=Chitinimonas sp. TaxID=1934313 RepID=UPI0035AF7D1D